VDELQRRIAAEAFLDEVFDGLDVVVGRAFDRLDAPGILDGEVVRELAQHCDFRRVEGRQFDDSGLRRQRQQPFDFDPHAGLDQPVFREDRTQRIDLGGVASIDGRQGGQCVVGHP
jgi:hypothetical protein